MDTKENAIEYILQNKDSFDREKINEKLKGVGVSDQIIEEAWEYVSPKQEENNEEVKDQPEIKEESVENKDVEEKKPEENKVEEPPAQVPKEKPKSHIGVISAVVVVVLLIIVGGISYLISTGAIVIDEFTTDEDVGLEAEEGTLESYLLIEKDELLDGMKLSRVSSDELMTTSSMISNPGKFKPERDKIYKSLYFIDDDAEYISAVYDIDGKKEQILISVFDLRTWGGTISPVLGDDYLITEEGYAILIQDLDYEYIEDTKNQIISVHDNVVYISEFERIAEFFPNYFRTVSLFENEPILQGYPEQFKNDGSNITLVFSNIASETIVLEAGTEVFSIWGSCETIKFKNRNTLEESDLTMNESFILSRGDTGDILLSCDDEVLENKFISSGLTFFEENTGDIQTFLFTYNLE